MTGNRDTLLCALGVGAVTLWGSVAAAQQPFTIETFEATTAAHGALGVDAASVPTHLAPYADAVLHRASQSVVYRGDELLYGIDDRWVLDVGAGIGLLDWLQLDARLPLVATQRGIGIDGVFAAVAAGDLRLRVKSRLLAHDADRRFGLALQAAVYLPSGDPEGFATDGAVRVEPRLLFDARLGPVLVLANVGYQVRPRRDVGAFRHDDVVRWATAVRVPVAAGFELETSVFGESSPFLAAVNGETMGNSFGHPIEALGGVAWGRGGFRTGLAGGVGLSRGVGAPAYRLMWSVGYAPPANGRPEEPLVVDEATLRALVAEADGGDDRDGDGVWGVEDLCPEDVGAAATSGCPPIDPVPEDALDDPSWRGRFAVVSAGDCDPSHAECTATSNDVEEQLDEAVFFPTALDRFKPEEHPLLERLANRLHEDSTIVKLIIEGHADSIGAKEYNLELSRGRAATVYRVMVRRGIDPSRLEMVAYGEDQPLADNDTVEGRQRNRRVSFRIVTRRRANDDAPPPTLSIADFDFDRRMLIGFRPARFLEGTVLGAPSGWQCTINGGEFATEVTLATTGAPIVQGFVYPGWTTNRALLCRQDRNVVVFNIEVEIPPFGIWGAERVHLSDSEPTDVDVRFAGRAMPLDLAVDGYQQRDQIIAADSLRLRLQREGDAPVSTARVMSNTHTLLEVPVLEVQHTTEIVLPQPRRDHAELTAGAVFLYGGDALAPAGTTISGLRVGLNALAANWFSAGFFTDIAATLGTNPVYFTPGIGASATIHLPANLVRPFISTGVQVFLPNLNQLRPALDNAIGLDVAPTPNAGLRAAVRGVVTTHNNTFVLLPGAYLGGFTSF